eukprot:TRINITY_DN77043_c0_g1_i1.p1 TRINITY_DN77043_c0_g1~~TRINITY_DN77043_c0_g1_i1.p1  ORF type:complete len:230 (-),score=32.42 TRINITY_DN77043_c0_g1_i1:76-744(-)
MKNGVCWLPLVALLCIVQGQEAAAEGGWVVNFHNHGSSGECESNNHREGAAVNNDAAAERKAIFVNENDDDAAERKATLVQTMKGIKAQLSSFEDGNAFLDYLRTIDPEWAGLTISTPDGQLVDGDATEYLVQNWVDLFGMSEKNISVYEDEEVENKGLVLVNVLPQDDDAQLAGSSGKAQPQRVRVQRLATSVQVCICLKIKVLGWTRTICIRRTVGKCCC